MSVVDIPQLTYGGSALDMNQVGLLRRSDDALHDRDELHRRMGEDGYLYLPGLLDRDQVVAARQELCDRLHGAGMLDFSRPIMECVAAPQAQIDAAATGPFMPELARDNAPLSKVIYDGAMMDFYTFFLGGPVRHFDYTWFRAKQPARARPLRRTTTLSIWDEARPISTRRGPRSAMCFCNGGPNDVGKITHSRRSGAGIRADGCGSILCK